MRVRELYLKGFGLINNGTFVIRIPKSVLSNVKLVRHIIHEILEPLERGVQTTQ